MNDMPDLSAVTYHLDTPVFRYHQHQGDTNDCGPTSLAIAANALLDEERFYGPTVAEEMNAPAFEVRPFPHFVVRRVRNWATFPWGIVHYLRQNDIPARWSILGSVDRLRDNLVSNRITIVILGELWCWEKRRYAGWAHAKVLLGYTPGQEFFFVDPAYACSRKESTLEHHGIFGQAEQDFQRQWRNILKIYIEVGQ
jgi:hypothetical protein